MGKTQSKAEAGDVYMVRPVPVPVAYDLETATNRPLSPSQGFVVLKPSQTPRRPPRRSRSLTSLHDRGTGGLMMASSKWKTATTRKDILDRKAYYMGRYQTKSITEANLETLRRALRQAKLKKTRIKMSPLGFSFGTKPGGILNTDKVAYQFVPLEDIETLRLDSIMRDVLLCIFRIDHNRNIQNGHVHNTLAQHYEINAFHVEPRDAVVFQRAHGDFKSKGPLYQQMYSQEPLNTRTMSYGNVNGDNSWKAPHGNNNNMVTLGSSRSERDVRVRHDSGDIYQRSTHTRGSVDYTDTTSTTYVQGGTDLIHNQPRLHRHKATRDASTSPMYPEALNGVLTHSSGHSITRKVFFHGNLPMADVECQISQDTHLANGHATDATTHSSHDTSSTSFRSQTSSQSTLQSGSRVANNKNDFVKRRMRTLTQEIDELRTMVEDGDDKITNHHYNNGIGDITEERPSSSISDSTVHANGPSVRVNTPPTIVDSHKHAGIINTKLGKVDVVVGLPTTSSTNHQSAGVRRSYPDGYTLEPQTVNPESRVHRRPSDQSRSEVAGRYVYYRPVTPEPQPTYRREYHVRSRSTEPPRTGRKKHWK